MDDKDFYMRLYGDFAEHNKLIKIDNYCGKEFQNKSNLYLEKIPDRLKLFHEGSNGFEIRWQAKKIEGLFGGINFISIENIYENYFGQLYFEEDLAEDPLIEVFRPFDEFSQEVRCGFIDHPTENIESIYLHTTSNTCGTQDLDINFDGYIELMKMCWAYNNWPFILLYLQEDDDTKESKRPNQELVNNFKRDMPKIFPDFSWDDFVIKYDSIRLSKISR